MTRHAVFAGIVAVALVLQALDAAAQEDAGRDSIDPAAIAQQVAYVGVRTAIPGALELGVLDLSSHEIIASIPIRPLRIAFTPDGRTAYVTGWESPVLDGESTSVFVIDAIRHAVVHRISMETETSGVAVSRHGQFAYVTHPTTGTVSVIDTRTHIVMTTIGVGRGPGFVAFAPDGNDAYVANVGDGTVSVIDTSSHAVTATIPTLGAAPRHVSFAPDGAFAYVGHLFSSDIAVIDTVAQRVVASVQTSATHSDGVVQRPASNEIYIFSQGGDPILRILNRESNSIVAEVPVNGITLADAAFSEDGTQAYILSTDSVHVFDTLTRTETRAIQGLRGLDIEARPVTPVLNHMIELVVTGTSCCVGNEFVIVATLTNTSSVAIHTPFFQVVTLTEGNLLANADHAPFGTGATLAADAGDDGVLSPGESRTARFVISLQTRNAFQFFVALRGRTP